MEYRFTYMTVEVGKSPQIKKGCEAMEMLFYSRILRILWTEYVSNKNILDNMEIKTAVIRRI